MVHIWFVISIKKFSMPKDGKPGMLFVHCIRYGGRISSVRYFLECFFFFIKTNMDKKCNICSGRILSQSRTMKCVLCYNHCHLKCISLNNEERTNILRDTNYWYCHLCLSSVFQFNHIGDDSEFYKAICTTDIWNVDLLDLSDKVFNPLENLNRELNDLLDDYNPDLKFTIKFIKNLCINVTTWQNLLPRTSYHYPRV